MSDFINALLGGAIIAVGAGLSLLFNGKISGISGAVNGAIFGLSDGRLWKLSLTLGLISGAFMFNQSFPDAIQVLEHEDPVKVLLAGFLVGLGSLMANGCTSGHAVCGVARLSPRSIVATLLFIMAGMLTVYLI